MSKMITQTAGRMQLGDFAPAFAVAVIHRGPLSLYGGMSFIAPL